MRNQKSIASQIDWVTVLLYLLLVLLGWINIYAAVYNDEHQSIFDLSQNYGRQLIWIVTSILLFSVILIIDAEFYTTFAYPIYGVILLILISVIFLGVEINGSRSWFAIGDFRVQPAEFAKFATCLALSKFLSNINIKMEDIKTKLIAGLIIAVPPLIIIGQNETGSALVFGAFVFVLYREGLSGNYLLLGLLSISLFILALLFDKIILVSILAGISLVMILLVKKKASKIIPIILFFLLSSIVVYSVDYLFETKLQPHQKNRINVLLGKEMDLKGAGYNVNQSKIAIGSGGLTGKGFLQGTQTKYNFVPEQSTDFIFCTIGEEWGFLGSTLVIGLFIILLMRLLVIAERQRSPFSRIYGYGVASIIFFHMVINIGMTIGLAPVIGIPLPFFSYGGSSLWSFTILLFIFLKLDSSRLNILN
ncbi:MAG: rod shape-determining protein RodA [Bacteroidetes bacterium]|nr:rod shape-determining protein RodA [Bacteroidota bacterium]HET6243467.1 rod shape-determining protein RodA [Bacteroidia bacterium]